MAQTDGDYVRNYTDGSYPNPGVVSRNPDGSLRLNVTDPGQGTNKAATGSTPYGLDRYGNPLPPPGPGNFAVTGSVSYDPQGNLLTSSAQSTAPTPTASAPKSGNVQQDWTSFIQSKGYTGANGRTNLPQYVDEFNKAYGYNARAGNPNASGTTDTIDFGNGSGWTDVIHGGDNAWQWLVEGAGGGGRPQGVPVNGAPSMADLMATAPGYQAPARTYNASEILQGGTNPNAGREQSLLDLMQGISTGSRPESANPNFSINGSDPIIKNQVDAYDAAQQRSSRNALDALAEKEGTHANIGAETRHAAEASGQATGAFQASLIGQELTARRQEAEQALQLNAQYLTADQQRQAQMKIEQLRNAEQQYEFDNAQGQSNSQFTSSQSQVAKQFAAQLAQGAYQFDTNQQFLNSPLGSS